MYVDDKKLPQPRLYYAFIVTALHKLTLIGTLCIMYALFLNNTSLKNFKTHCCPD